MVPPLKLKLKPNIKPYRCKPRNYSHDQRAFLKRFCKKLLDRKFIYPNRNSRWASRALPIRKGVDDFRLTSDYQEVNKLVDPLAGMMPFQANILKHTQGMNFFGLFDFLKGFWQLPLSIESQEILSFMTDEGIYSPTRVPQGCTDAALHFQATMEECFKELLYSQLLIWIDDMLLFGETIEEYLDALGKFFKLLVKFGLKLSVKKSSLFEKEVTWCGRIIDGQGVRHDPQRLKALIDMPIPETAGELQQFLCASNWLRDSLIDYARVFKPLQDKLDEALQGGKRNKKTASGIKLTFSDELIECYKQAKEVLATSATLSHPTDDGTMCLFTDASDSGWAVVLTQVQEWDSDKKVADQSHQLLHCMSGKYTGAQLNWSVIEKEAFPIVHACSKLDYLLLRPKGFKMYCDHRNLIHVFAPGEELKKHVRGKLQRWAMKLMEMRYTIEHIEGPHNVWADMISRWAGGRPEVSTLRRLTYRKRSRRPPRPSVNRAILRPLDEKGFIWPSLEEIATVQEKYLTEKESDKHIDQGLDSLWRVQDKVWIPASAADLITRICVIAHCGSQGHRGLATMLAHIKKLFYFPKMEEKVKNFLSSCLLCQHVKGGKIIPRPWSETFRSSIRNGALHWDFVHLGQSYGTSEWVLVMKDEFTHYCELIVCDTPSSEVAVEGLLEWQKRYGIPPIWISDQGSHFKNQVLTDFARRMKSQQHFTVAYSPWTNGTVERVNRDIKQVLRIMLSEYKLDEKAWPHLIPLIQANLNHTPVASLKGKTPAQLFMGLLVTTPLDSLFRPHLKEYPEKVHIDSAISEALTNLHDGLSQMHKEVAEQREQQRSRNQQQQKYSVIPNFHEGDYVLYSRVDHISDGNKLWITWLGPYKVTRADTYSYRIQHLLTGEEKDVHASRLKFYADEHLEVSEELLDHISMQGIKLKINGFKEHRWNDQKNDFEFFVSWQGLEDIENSWEPMATMLKDVPTIVEKYIGDKGEEKLQTHAEFLRANNFKCASQVKSKNKSRQKKRRRT